MPLAVISGLDAFENTRLNPHNMWPTREDFDNRVEPIAKPVFQPSFKIETSESVFTIGSCFARNVEKQLERLGFDVPMRNVRISDDDENAAGDVDVFNNYSVPSILNELQWAVDPDHHFDKETGLLEVSKDAYCDLHLTRLIKPVSLDVAMKRRERIAMAMRSVTKCKVVIITLGLVEVWWDNVAGRYLNIAPLKQAAKRQPGRFELHVLDYRETITYLEKIMALLDRFCVEGYRVVLTVSPIPLGITFTTQDVIIANTYSKSVLRAAAQEIYHRFDHVDYFPSYESVTLSDRAVAFQPDMRHATADIIAINVNRMIAAYTGNDGDRNEALLERAQAADKSRDMQTASDLYRRIVDAGAPPTQAIIGLGRCTGELGRGDEALAILRPLLGQAETRIEAARAMAVVCRRNKMTEAFAEPRAVLETAREPQSMRELIITTFELDDHEATLKHCAVLAKLSPRSPIAYEYMGRISALRGDVPAACGYLREALSRNQNLPQVFGLLGQLLLGTGNTSEASDAFTRALALNPRNRDALDGLQALKLHHAGLHAQAAPQHA